MIEVLCFILGAVLAGGAVWFVARSMLATMKSEFKALSAEVLKEKRAELETEGVAGLEKVTLPLINEVQAFRKRVDEINSEDVRRTTELKTKIEHLVRETNLVTEQADRLATAIRSEAQVTGQWGEIQLKRVLELGGLEETVDYDYQSTFTSPGADHADLRTDVLVKMPDDRWLVIDAKTTMAAYIDYIGPEGTRNEEAMDRILASLVAHVKEMKKAEYHKKIAAATGKKVLNTMFMYIPFEEVYLVAMKAQIDTSTGKMPLRDWAWENDVVFVNSSGLIPVVRMLAELWARDRAERKALKIREAAEGLIEKFITFMNGAGAKKDGFYGLGQALNAAVNAYNESLKRICDGKGSVIKRLNDMKEMGVKAAEKVKSTNEVESRIVNAVALEAQDMV